MFRERAEWPRRDEELSRYALHENRVDDPGYVTHLERLAKPMLERLPEGAKGIDFGSGAAPALAWVFTRAGRPTASYDPAVGSDDSVLAARYQFASCSEVLEHVHEPLPFLRRLGELVEPGGLIGIMTGMRDGVRFEAWWYRRDPTHVCFYSRATMEWIARTLDWMAEFPGPNITLFQTSAVG